VQVGFPVQVFIKLLQIISYGGGGQVVGVLHNLLSELRVGRELLEALGTRGASSALEVVVDIGEVDMVVLVETDVAVTHEVEL
jgi:hypothetical protein